MVPEMEKPRVTEIKVRMDCNGCVHKIKKALHGIAGIYDIYVDFPQQKITVIGWADPEKIAKAIKKTRKSAIICSHIENSDTVTKPEPELRGGTETPPPPESTESPQNETTPLPDGQDEQPPPPPASDNPPPEEKASSESDDEITSQASQTSKPNDVQESHVTYHHPPNFAYNQYPQQGNGARWNAYPGIREELHHQPVQPVYVTHSYNAYKPSPYVTEYVYPRSPREHPQYYNRPEYYNPVYYSSSSGSNNNNGNITSMFSEENPNACIIV